MSSRTSVVVLVVGVLAACLAAVVWYRASGALRASDSELVSNVLVPMATLLKEDQGLIQELSVAPYTEPGSGILESYLLKIRRDGMAKNAQMKQRLEALADNNTALLTLINAYSRKARALRFSTEAEKFRKYAISWRDRWNSLMELFMAGGDYPSSGVPFPTGFA